MTSLSNARLPYRTALMAGAVAYALASTAAIAAPRILFANRGANPAGTELTGRVAVDGSTQIVLDNGGMISLVGPGTLNFAPDGTIALESGNATLVSGSAPLTVVTPQGPVTVRQGSASLGVAQGQVTGFALAGMLAGPNGSTITSGSPFKITASGIARTVAGAVRPVAVANARTSPYLIDSPTTVAQVLQNGVLLASLNGATGVPIVGNLSIADYPSNATIASLLAQALAEAKAASGFDFTGLPASVLTAQLDFLRAGGQAGTLNGVNAAAFVSAYLDFLAKGGKAGAFSGGSDQLFASYLEFLRAAGLPANLDAAVKSQLNAYLAFLASGGAIGSLPQTTPDRKSVV